MASTSSCRHALIAAHGTGAGGARGGAARRLRTTVHARGRPTRAWRRFRAHAPGDDPDLGAGLRTLGIARRAVAGDRRRTRTGAGRAAGVAVVPPPHSQLLSRPHLRHLIDAYAAQHSKKACAPSSECGFCATGIRLRTQVLRDGSPARSHPSSHQGGKVTGRFIASQDATESCVDGGWSGG